MERKTYFVDIILPLALPRLYTYRVPYELNNNIRIGQRVIVQFGKQKVYTGLVKSIHEQAPEDYQTKYILSILDEEPVAEEVQFEFWDWIAKYYMCTMGEVMNAALPSGLKLSSETNIVLSDTYNESDEIELSEKEKIIVDALKAKETLKVSEISLVIEQKTIYPYVNSLLEKNVILLEEELIERFKPKYESYINITEEYYSEEKLQELYTKLERAPKQLELLISYIGLSQFFNADILEVKKKDLLKSVDVNTSIITSMIKKGIFEQYEKEVGRLKKTYDKLYPPYDLNESQVIAYNEIKVSYLEKDVVLFHGITSSGKTEIYIHLIKEALEKGEQVLYLLPEIALTTQIINRLKKVFGNQVYVYHSKFNENERVETWNKVLESNKTKEPLIVIGPRSAMFLPFKNLGFIIIDEEHENSFKQQNPSPRYNARDAAIYLGLLNKAKVLLGSATPSIESYFNAKAGKYALVELTSRYKDIKLPSTIIIDTKNDTKKKRMKSHFSQDLLNEIEIALGKKEQVILFQNRRGFSPILECEMCGWVPQCKSCDVSLTYHKHINQLKCHYCGFSITPPRQCGACGNMGLVLKGFGTEKIEEELKIYFPDANVKRMDLDTTRSKDSYYNIIRDFEDKNIDVLVGTQMITKGLDFDNVSLVGILNADNMINFPDFRSYEKSYQLMVQVSGRAGRKEKQGKVVIQTWNPEHSVIDFVIRNDYQAMFKNELLQRRNFKYPPFYKLIQISLKHRNVYTLNELSVKFANQLRSIFGNRVLGPEFPSVSRVKNFYIKNILLKIERDRSLIKSKELINTEIIKFKTVKENRAVIIQIDVDPL